MNAVRDDGIPDSINWCLLHDNALAHIIYPCAAIFDKKGGCAHQPPTHSSNLSTLDYLLLSKLKLMKEQMLVSICNIEAAMTSELNSDGVEVFQKAFINLYFRTLSIVCNWKETT